MKSFLTRYSADVKGFRNRDLRVLLFGEAATPAERSSQMAKTTRMIRMLRAHGLVHKVSKTHRYTLSPTGRQAITALLAARNSTTKALCQLAA